MKNVLIAVILITQLLILNVSTQRPSRRPCPKLILRNGRVRNRPKTFAQFSCNRGYTLIGDRFSKCINGVWDSAPPICAKPSCKLPTLLENGMVYPSLKNSVIRFFCMPDYDLKGPSYAFCDGDMWSNHLPSCIPSNTTASVTCDFESKNICGWSHDLNHNFEWERMSGKTPSGHVGTGPSYDHTLGRSGTGYYMYIESTTRNENDMARLISPIHPKQTGRTCLEFYYHMYGSGIGELRVYLKKTNESWRLDVDDAIFRAVGNKGNVWLKEFIDLGIVNNYFQIIFEGIRGNSYVSDIAIDDVKLIENCPEDVLTTITTDVTIDTSTIAYESCENRCFQLPSSNNDTTLPSDIIPCDCDQNCIERSNCCPDFSNFCIIDSTDTTEGSYEDATTTLKSVDSNLITTIAPTTIKIISTTPSTTASTEKSVPTTKPASSTIKYKTTSTTTSTSTAKPSKATKRIIPSISTTLILTNVPRTTRTTRTTKTTTTEIIEFIDDVVPITTQPDDVEFPVETVTVTSSIGEKENILGITQIAADHKMKIAIGGLGLTLFVITVVLIVKRDRLRHCARIKKMRSSGSDSQSDVRFLTSDEILDFNLAYR